MQKIAFSLKRTLAVTAAGIFGFILNIAIIFYFLLPEPADFAYVQWACLGIGVFILSCALQYVLINLVKKYMPLKKENV
jgi:hypothetical protein